MKQILLFLFLLATITVSAQNSQEMEGTWLWESPNGQNTMKLELEYENQKIIRGNHCVVFYQGEKSDCKRGEEGFSLNLIKIAEGIYEGTIESAVSATTGRISLQYMKREKAIRFYLKKAPSGKFYMPKEAFLVR
jgi:hypothetical protein